jgi:hypothetical protein
VPGVVDIDQRFLVAANRVWPAGPVVFSATIGGDRCNSARRAGARRLRPSCICDPSVPASPAYRYGKEAAETENKAKKKLSPITTVTNGVKLIKTHRFEIIETAG